MSYKSDVKKVERIQESENFPKVILIDNCNACNLQCSMCDHPNVSAHRKIQLMPFGLYTKIIDEISIENPNVRVWEIFFGDPFMCGDISKRIAYAKNKGLTDVVLNSNGVKMTSKRAEEVISAGLDAMYVGIDAATKETYDKIRVGGDFNKAVKNVLTYRDLLNKIGTDNQKLYVQFVISDINEKEVDRFKAFWLSEGIKVKIRPKVSWAGLVQADNLSENNAIKRKPCYWLIQTINICADGRIALCSVDVHCRVPCGDANKNSIKDLWGGQLKRYRELHKNLQFEKLPEMCRLCRDWQSGYAEFFDKA